MKTQILKEYSNRITLVRYPLMLMVVMIHNIFTSNELGKPIFENYELYFHKPLSYITMIAVPMFFMISGYLLFSKIRFNSPKYSSILKNKFHTLVIPFILWNSFVFLFYFIGQNLSVTKPFFINNKFLNWNNYDYIFQTFGLNTFYPISIQFWFIRNLFVFICIYPICRYIKALSIMQFGILFILIYVINTSFIQIKGFCYFIAGAYLAYNNFNLVKIDKFKYIIIGMFFITILCNIYFNLPLILPILFGIISLWIIAGICEKCNILNKFLIYLSPSTFFLFAFHLIPAGIIRRCYVKVIHPTTISLIVGYFICLIITLVLSHLIYLILNKYVPKFLIIVCGNRTAKEN